MARNLITGRQKLIRGIKKAETSLFPFEAMPRDEIKEVSSRWPLNRIRKPLPCGVDVGYGPTNSRETAFLCQKLGGNFCFGSFLPGQMQVSAAVWVEILKKSHPDYYYINCLCAQDAAVSLGGSGPAPYKVVVSRETNSGFCQHVNGALWSERGLREGRAKEEPLSWSGEIRGGGCLPDGL